MNYEKIIRQMIADEAISKEVAAKYFPELKENEGEKYKSAIRKMYSFLPNKPNYIGDVSVEDMFAWLENQGEQKQIRQQCADFYNKDSELQMSRLTAFENELADILFEREYDGSTETEDDIQRGRLEYELAAIRLAPKLQSLINIEQKPVEWSKEDREYMKSLLDIINGTPSLTPSEVECHKDWLKSLKGRYAWKPTKEQLNALRVAIGDEQGSDCCCALRDLLIDLKSL